ncbi:cyclic nucleotide-binding domain-containing protein [Agaribacterium haliotis]|uniref:cyclic nucleotide-binding domain-containing protein n=1 Tax=Agaribacterium haliotis TaxID=2013869 RepID=UPI000BB55C87|nr:cyclic nucleotide-binding domain-containing protein [Agaribacterium haliotis]
MHTVTNLVDPLSPILRDALATASSLVPLKSLRHGYLEELFQHASALSLFHGQYLFEKGQSDKRYIFLLSGEVALNFSAAKKLASTSERLEANCVRLNAQNCISALAHTQPRACSAIALGDVLAVAIDVSRLQQCLAWSQTTDYMLSELAVSPDFDGDLDWIKTVLSSNLFIKVPPTNARHIIPELEPLSVKAGERLIREGEVGDCCYFLKSGEAQVLKTIDGAERALAKISPGRCFGEDALIDDKPRNASVEFVSDAELLRLDKKAFVRLLSEPEVDSLSWSDRAERVLVDIRTDAEYGLGHLDQAVNVPLAVMAMKRRLLNKEQAYLLYCDSGLRSRSATHLLSQQGYNVAALHGGLEAQGLTTMLTQHKSYLLRDGRAAPVE